MARRSVQIGLLGLILLGAGVATCAPARVFGLVRPSSPARPGPAVVAAVPQTNLFIDAGTRYQTIDGWGVNANPKNWGNPAYPPLKPGLDLLVHDLGANLWRVDVYGTSMWEAVNDNSDPFTYNWAYYNNLYATDPAFQSLWATLQELNAQGIQPILSASGQVPAWMGGTTINNNDEFAETFASLVYYARNTAHIQFTLVDPLNETDICGGSTEGPCVAPAQFDTILGKLRARFVQLGMSDLRFVTPETSTPDTAYDGAILADPGVAPYVAAYAGHVYGVRDMGPVVTQIKTSAYPQPNFWMAEYSSGMYGPLDNGLQVPDEWAFTEDMYNNLFSAVSTGASAALVWDAYDNVHDHSGHYTYWGLLDTLNGYTPRKRYYGAKQVFAYVKPGSVRVQASSSLNGVVDVLGFVNDATGTLTIVGMNSNTTPQTIVGSIANVASPQSLSLYQTTSTQNDVLAGSVAVSGGAFTVTVAANSIFTLTGSSCAACPTSTPTATVPPLPTNTPAATSTPVPAGQTLTFGYTPTVGVNDNSDFGDLNGSSATVTAPGTLLSLSVYAGAVTPGSHVRLALYSTNATGNPGQLLTQTGDAVAAAGWNTIATSPVALSPGTYWILAQTDGVGTVYRMATGLAPSYAVGWTGQPYAYGVFPSTVSPWVTTASQSFAMYGTMLTAGASPTPTPTALPRMTPTPCGPLADPCNIDTDQDGYSDQREIALGKNPLVYCPIMRADVNGDGTVNVLDLATVALFYGEAVPPAPARYLQGPPPFSGVINILDLAKIAAQYQNSISACP